MTFYVCQIVKLWSGKYVDAFQKRFDAISYLDQLIQLDIICNKLSNAIY